MTSHNPKPATGNHPFHRYLDATHAARDAYLATTYHAHLTYLSGPWPDRQTYQRVETSAWEVYYQASRAAWQRYADEVASPEKPTAPQHSPDLTATWDALEAEHGPNCLDCGYPWRDPSPWCPRHTYNVHPRGPLDNPQPEGSH